MCSIGQPLTTITLRKRYLGIALKIRDFLVSKDKADFIYEPHCYCTVFLFHFVTNILSLMLYTLII